MDACILFQGARRCTHEQLNMDIIQNLIHYLCDDICLQLMTGVGSIPTGLMKQSYWCTVSVVWHTNMYMHMLANSRGHWEENGTLGTPLNIHISHYSVLQES